ncbi:MAG: sugar phosphate isomerase/epimerase, partial [Chloroflexota bacterium]|nr:sugar phosphate isomerase/epimerase [Chloroflexota bacterium]
DTWSMNKQGVDLPRSIEEFGGTLAHVHLNDDNKRWPGSGGIDFPSIASALKSINYDGYVSVEVFDLSPDPETIATEAIKYLRAVFGS